MSYLFYPIFGGIIAIIVGSLTSLICDEKFEGDINPMLFSPFVRRFLQLNEGEKRKIVTHTFEAKDTKI